MRPGFGAGGLDVDEEVEGLGAVGVEDAVFGRGGHEWGGGVLAAEDGEDRFDVEG